MTLPGRKLPGFATGAATQRPVTRPAATTAQVKVLQVRRAPTQLSLFQTPASQFASSSSTKKA